MRFIGVPDPELNGWRSRGRLLRRRAKLVASTTITMRSIALVPVSPLARTGSVGTFLLTTGRIGLVAPLLTAFPPPRAGGTIPGGIREERAPLTVACGILSIAVSRSLLPIPIVVRAVVGW